MIGKLIGKVDELYPDHMILDVSGVGYVVYCCSKLLSATKQGDDMILHVETVVREMQITLFGFAEGNEKFWFNMLQEVQGVGAKAALAILDINFPDAIISAIAAKDDLAFKRVSGIGDKIAKRIVNELSTKRQIKAMLKGMPAGAAASNANNAQDDALSALLNLGFNRAEILKIIDKVASNDDLSSEEIIKHALQELGNK